MYLVQSKHWRCSPDIKPGRHIADILKIMLNGFEIFLIARFTVIVDLVTGLYARIIYRVLVVRTLMPYKAKKQYLLTLKQANTALVLQSSIEGGRCETSS